MDNLPDIPADLYRRLAMVDDLSEFYDKSHLLSLLEDLGWKRVQINTTFSELHHPEIDVRIAAGPRSCQKMVRDLAEVYGTSKRALEMKIIRHRGGPKGSPPDYQIGGEDE